MLSRPYYLNYIIRAYYFITYSERTGLSIYSTTGGIFKTMFGQNGKHQNLADILALAYAFYYMIYIINLSFLVYNLYIVVYKLYTKLQTFPK